MTDDLLILLTAAVDGEATPSEQWYVHRMLSDSVEARTLFARLQSDSIRLKNLRKAAPANLVARVMSKLPHAASWVAPCFQPVQRGHRLEARCHPDRSRIWVAVAIAASLLIAVGAGARLLFPKPTGLNPGAEFAQGQPSFADVLPKENSPLSMPPAVFVPPANHVAYGPPLPPELPDRSDEIPPPRIKGADVLVAPPLRPIPPLDKLIVRVPLLVSVSDLEREDSQQRLLEELGREPAYRIDLFAKDAGRGVELLQAAAKNTGLNLLADATALERMKRKQATSYLVYTESLSAAEIRDLFARIAADESKSPQRVFDSLHVTPALPADQVVLKELLGTDPGLWKRPIGAALPVEPKPISAGTGDQLAKSLTATTNKHAVLLTFTPAASRTNPAMSKELKEFLAKRGERKASAVPILIVIRQPNGG